MHSMYKLSVMHDHHDIIDDNLTELNALTSSDATDYRAHTSSKLSIMKKMLG